MQSKMNRGKAIFVALGFMFTGSHAFADPIVSYSKWVEEIKFSGDLRLRHENFDKRTAGQTDRQRQRFRLRLNTDIRLPANFQIKMTLASGTGEQVSTNQSFDNLSSQKDIYIDKIFAIYQPLTWLKLQGGKMENPIWRQYSSDVVWDSDFGPEGFSQGIEQLVGPFNIFVNALQMVVDEDSGFNVGVSTQGKQADQWMFAHQIGIETKLPFEKRLRFAYANYYWHNENQGTFSQVATNEGNRRSSSVLSNNFNVDEFTGELFGWMFNKPLSLQFTAVENRGARGNLNSKHNNGYQIGGIFGKAREKNTFELAYFNKQVRTDATVADVADSDFGDGGTNRKGHIAWISYAPLDWMVVTIKHFDTEVIEPALSPNRDDINRTQVDWSVKF
ncbi:MAG: putative porin [Elusimicrobiota bacterium]